jgi:N-acetyl-1-D-myo-inositol-2-amino-2-deoxy-alpha-D-glucopyranoside deacetylase
VARVAFALRLPIGTPLPALLCVHPHPDDETIACGGVLARYTAEGGRVMVVTCTAGEEGENLSGIDLGDDEMVSVRRRELAAALEALGVEEHEFLGYRDSGMADTDANRHPEAFAAADTDEAARRLADVILRFRPDVVVSDDAKGSYGHPDHVKAHEVTVRAVELAAAAGDDAWRVRKRYVHALPSSRLLEFHRRMLEEGLASPFGEEPLDGLDEVPFGVPDEAITTAIDVRPWLDRKRAALEAHASQIGPESFFLNLPEDVGRDVFGTEYFVLEDSEQAAEGHPDGRETDLFAGLRD